MASQSHRICVADTSFFQAPFTTGVICQSQFERCPFRWQCPVNSPTTLPNWPLFNFNSSFVLVAESPSISPFAYFSPVIDSQCFLWFLCGFYEWMFRSCSCQQICCFIIDNTLMTWHPYQLNFVMFGQLYEGLIAIADQFWGDLVFAKCFNCSLTDRI
jgi:hypothetical protein